jgi:hypothetical protein
MSDRERCIDIIEKIPDERLPYIAALLENSYKIIEEAFDDAFCIALAERHKRNNPQFNKDDFMPIEEVAEKFGVILDDN